jgi:hypothetical protein
MKRLLSTKNLFASFVGLASVLAALSCSAMLEEPSTPIDSAQPKEPHDLWLMLFCLSVGDRRYELPAFQAVRAISPEVQTLSVKGDF